MKQGIRREIRKKLSAQSAPSRAKKSAYIKKKLFNEKVFKRTKWVMFYVSTDTEVDTSEMIDEALRTGKRVCVPIVSKKDKLIKVSEIRDRLTDLEEGHFGIHEPKKGHLRPVPLEDIDLVIVPGVAFDKRNIRLGQGHGYYDRFLSLLPNGTKTIGLAFDFQVVENLPQRLHDIPVDKVITG